MQTLRLCSLEVLGAANGHEDVEISLDAEHGQPAAYPCTITWDAKHGARIGAYLASQGHTVTDQRMPVHQFRVAFTVAGADPLAAMLAVRGMMQDALDWLGNTNLVYMSEPQGDLDPDHLVMVSDTEPAGHTRACITRELLNEGGVDFNDRRPGVKEFIAALRACRHFTEVTLGEYTELDLSLTPDASANPFATYQCIIELYQTHLT